MAITANIIVKNNSIDQGYFSDGAITSNYTYNGCAILYGSALVEGNFFLNPAAASDMLRTVDSDFNIKNNKFVRGATSINYYIRHTHTAPAFGNSQIIDNTFDQRTTDGINLILVNGLVSGTTYTRNKNQIGKIYIPLFDNAIGSNTAGISDKLQKFVTEDTTIDSGFLMRKPNIFHNLITQFIQDDTITNPQFLYFTKSFNVGDYLERGMLLEEIRMGGFRSAGALTTYNSGQRFRIRLEAHEGSLSMDATQSTIVDTQEEFLYTYTIDTALKFSNLSVATQYTSASGTTGSTPAGNYYGFINPDVFTVGNGYHQRIEVDIAIAFDSSPWSMFFTPIELSYAWL